VASRMLTHSLSRSRKSLEYEYFMNEGGAKNTYTTRWIVSSIVISSR